MSTLNAAAVAALKTGTPHWHAVGQSLIALELADGGDGSNALQQIVDAIGSPPKFTLPTGLESDGRIAATKHCELSTSDTVSMLAGAARALAAAIAVVQAKGVVFSLPKVVE